jgi:putative spermidine/putrescine transport system ATP-binding protein
MTMADKIVVLNAGRIEQFATPEELYLRPASSVVAEFVGLSSLLPGTVVGDRVEVLGVMLPLSAPAPEGPAEVYIRPEHVRLVATDGVPAVVQESTFLGSLRRTRLKTIDGSSLRMQHAASERVEFDQPVLIALDPVPVTVRAAS